MVPREKHPMRCPRCTFPLRPWVYEDVEVDHCDRCHGTFLDRGETSILFGPDVEPEAWKDAWPTTDLGPTRLACPKDRHVLEGHAVAFEAAKVEVDTCPHCQGLWLDANEAHQLKDIIEDAQAKAARARSGLDKPGAGAYLMQIFTGFPVEAWNPVRNRPVLVLGLIALLSAIFILQVAFKDAMNADPGLLMLVPAEVLRGEHLWTILTSGFLHGGIAHLLGNLYFLYVFGDNVEDSLGKGRFLAVYFAAMLAGALLHAAVNAGSEMPMLGASGAISGIMGAYVVLFPKVRVYVVILFIRFSVGVTWYIGFWILLQVGMAALGEGGVAWFAHIGGFVAGAILAWGLEEKARYSALGRT